MTIFPIPSILPSCACYHFNILNILKGSDNIWPEVISAIHLEVSTTLAKFQVSKQKTVFAKTLRKLFLHLSNMV